MKNVFVSAFLLCLMILSGCANSSELVKICNLRGDVFCEISDQSPVPQGYADLLVILSLKTHKPGSIQMDDTHGTSDYGLMINIDGQGIAISGELDEENIEPRKLRDPEAGAGIRYQFRKMLRLKAGAHRIVIVIPTDEVAVEREIWLTEGSRNDLLLEPVYGARKSGGRMTVGVDKDFNEGIKGLQLLLNGKTL